MVLSWRFFFGGKMCVGKKFLSNRTKIEEKFVGGELLFCYHPKKKAVPYKMDTDTELFTR